MNYEATYSERGKNKIVFKDHLFVFEKCNKKGTRQYWKCERSCRKPMPCPARIHVEGDEVVKEVNGHSHDPIPGRKEVLDIVHNMKTEAKENPDKAPRLVMSKMAEVPDAFRGQFQSFNSKLKMIQDAKLTSKKDRPKVPKSMDFQIPEEFTLSWDKENMLFWDSGTEDPNRIIIFATEESLRQLEGSKHMFTNATYKACPSIFYQVWALHALVETTTIPLIVGMTANKSQDTYERIYRMVIERIPQFKPESFLLDMELANINAIGKVFPKCQIAICVFHLAQAIYRQVQSHGLQVIYRENPKVYQFVKNLVALAFVPVPQVKVYYRQVLDTIPDVSGIDEVVDYFERQYIEKRGGRPATIPIQWWNQHQLQRY